MQSVQGNRFMTENMAARQLAAPHAKLVSDLTASGFDSGLLFNFSAGLLSFAP